MYGLGKRPSTPTVTQPIASTPKAPLETATSAPPSEAPKPTRVKQTCTLLVAFSNDTLLADIILRDLKASDLIKLRSTCQDFADIVLRYLKDIVHQMPFMLGAIGPDLDFCEPLNSDSHHSIADVRVPGDEVLHG